MLRNTFDVDFFSDGSIRNFVIGVATENVSSVKKISIFNKYFRSIESYNILLDTLHDKSINFCIVINSVSAV